MTMNLDQTVPKLSGLPMTLPRGGAVEMELEQGILILRVSPEVQDRIEALLDKQRASGLAEDEEHELRQYEEIDDYLSFLNRLTRNLAQTQPQDSPRAA